MADKTDAAAVAGNVKDGCDTDIVAGALDDDGCAAAVCELKDLLLNRPDGRIYSVGCAIHHGILSSGLNGIYDDDICAGSCADHGGGAADGACTDDDTVVRSIGITAVTPDTPVCDVEVLDEDTDLIRPVFGNLVCVSFLEDHVLAESAGGVRSETDFSHVQACRRHLAVFAVCALMAGKDAVADDLVAFLDGGDAGADLDSSADPLVTGGVGSDVITAFCGLAFEALYIRLADTAGDQLDQDLIGLKGRKLQLFNSEIEGAVHKSCFAFCRTIFHGFFLSFFAGLCVKTCVFTGKLAS